MEKGSARWRERRWRRLRDLAPGWAGKGTKAAAERLITQAVAGNAWCAVLKMMNVAMGSSTIDMLGVTLGVLTTRTLLSWHLAVWKRVQLYSGF